MPWLTTETLIATAARLHPLVLHLPIGLVILLVTTELWRMLRKRRERHEFGWIAVWLAAVGSGAAVATGWFLGGPPEPMLEPGDPANMIAGLTQLEVHRWLGVAVAAGCALAAIMWSANWIRGYRAVVVLTAAVLVPAGHFGGEMTHGEGFVTEPIRRAMAEHRAAEAGPAAEVAPADGALPRGAGDLDAPGTTDAGDAGDATDATGAPDAEAPGVGAGFNDDGASAASAVDAAVQTISFARDIAPIIEASCDECHNDRRSKGGLAMHSYEAVMAGGRGGPIVVPGDAAASSFIERVTLPEDDFDHMPPPPRASLTPEQIGLIEAWIAAGALAEGGAPAPAGSGSEAAAAAPTGTGANAGSHAGIGSDTDTDTDTGTDTVSGLAAGTTAKIGSDVNSNIGPLEPAGPAPVLALRAIRDRFAHVAEVHLGSRRLAVDLAGATPAMDASEMIAVLEPLREHIAELSLARTAADDRLADVIASMPRLEQLDLSFSAAGDEVMLALAEHPRLRTLRIVGTSVSAASADAIASLPALQELYAWRSELPADALSRLAADRPELQIDADALAAAPAPELEPEVQLSSEVTDAEAAAVAALAADASGTDSGASPDAGTAPGALRAINDICPVADAPVDPKFTIVHKGRAIGFCCGNCVATFWDDPAPWVAKLPAP
ncbi:MAG: c-type cytochrome domain-containing protein [Phycisphaerales bacterium]